MLRQRTMRAARRTRQTGNRERRAKSGAGHGPAPAATSIPEPRFPAPSSGSPSSVCPAAGQGERGNLSNPTDPLPGNLIVSRLQVPTGRLGSTELMVSRIGLGLAALGRPAYINVGRQRDFGSERSVAALEQRCHEMLDAALRIWHSIHRCRALVRHGRELPEHVAEDASTRRRTRSRSDRSGATATWDRGNSMHPSMK